MLSKKSAVLRTGKKTLVTSILLYMVTPAVTNNVLAAPGYYNSQSASTLYQNRRNEDRGGIVYVMSNAAEGNEIFIYARSPRGNLRPLPRATVSTGGLGASENAPVDPLGSQNALIYSPEHNLLFGVNAGSNTIFAMDAGKSAPSRKGYNGLRPKLRALELSGGDIPVSVAVHDNLLYVLNAGGTGAVSTFAIGRKGKLTLEHTLSLGLENATGLPFNNVMAPGQVGVDTLARRLILTNAAGQEVLSTALDDDGYPLDELISTPTEGVVPFSFATTDYGQILVTEAGSGSVSSFDLSVPNQPLQEIAVSVANGQAATCWIIVHPAGFAYVSNTASDTISLYHYSRNGTLELLDATAAETGVSPTDMTLTENGRYLYTLDAGSGEISGFAINQNNGHLNPVSLEDGLPASSGLQGITSKDF